MGSSYNPPGGGGSTFPATTNIIVGTAVPNVGDDSGIDPNDVLTNATAFATAAQGATADSALQPNGDGSGLSGVLKPGQVISSPTTLFKVNTGGPNPEIFGVADSNILITGIVGGAASGATIGFDATFGLPLITASSATFTGQLHATEFYGGVSNTSGVNADQATTAQGTKADSAVQPGGAMAGNLTIYTGSTLDDSGIAPGNVLQVDGNIDNTTGVNADTQTFVQDALTALPLSGSFSGVGTATTTFTVTFGPTLSDTNYQVVATPSNILSAAVFYINNKTTTTFDVVYLAGLTGTVAFDWIVAP